MPGLSILAGTCRDAELADALGSIARTGERAESLYDASCGLQIGWLGYEGYPRRVIRSRFGVAIIEGTVCNASGEDLDAKVCGILWALHRSDRAGRDAAIAWARAADGDFVLAATAYQSGTTLIVNDSLGRLPLYLRESASRIVISRQIKAIASLGGTLESDRLSMAQMLLFGFPLGGRTLVRDIRILPAASAVTLSSLPLASAHYTYKHWNFEETEPLRKNGAQELAACFISTCAQQAAIPEFDGTVLQLSGGLDSRCVAAALTASGAAYSATSFSTADGVYERDALIAEEIAGKLHAPWRLYRLKEPDWPAMQASSLLCDGLNYCGMASRLQYLAQMRCDFGSRAMCFTGDGGDKAIPDLRAPWWANTPSRYVDYRLEDPVFTLPEVSALLRLPERAIREDLFEYFERYPERSPRNWEIRFLVMERGLNWLLQGEERNRAYLWHQTPFYGRAFFERAMRIQPDRKRHYALHREFLKAIDAELAMVPNAKWNAPAGSLRAFLHEIKPGLRSQVPSQIRRPLRRLRNSFAPPHPAVPNARTALVDEVRSLLQVQAAAEVFDTRMAGRVLQTCSREQLYYLATQLVYVSQT